MKRVEESRSRGVETEDGRASLRPPSSVLPVTHHPSPSPIRRARPEEAEAISELAFRSKAHWGYDAEFMERCRDDLTISADEIAASPVYVHESAAGGLAGFYSLAEAESGVIVLDDLFVDPAAMGMGVGRRLWEHAIATAKALGFAAMEFQSDPQAEGFYLAMGARRVGASESTVTPGRKLPLMRIDL